MSKGGARGEGRVSRSGVGGGFELSMAVEGGVNVVRPNAERAWFVEVPTKVRGDVNHNYSGECATLSRGEEKRENRG